jgi:predicted MPP superfamily phosphohydrolase
LEGKSVQLSSVSRRRFLQTASLFSLSSLSPDSSAYQLFTNEEIEVSNHILRLRNLPRSFEDIKLVHLTDIHHSKFVSFNDVFRMVELSNQQDPDVVLLTGDYVTWSKKFIPSVSEALKSLKSRLGVYAVLGNHDIRVNADEITQSLQGSRINVLRNSSAKIDLKGESLWIAGVDEYMYGQSDIARAIRDVPRSQPKILLAHNPEIIQEASRTGIDFVLAGHTHGGQIKIPYMRTLNVVTQPGREILEGFVRKGPTQMYISRGLGKVVVPIRILCPPEIPVFRLHA